jgi:hypothetical protein
MMEKPHEKILFKFSDNEKNYLIELELLEHYIIDIKIWTIL